MDHVISGACSANCPGDEARERTRDDPDPLSAGGIVRLSIHAVADIEAARGASPTKIAGGILRFGYGSGSDTARSI